MSRRRTRRLRRILAVTLGGMAVAAWRHRRSPRTARNLAIAGLGARLGTRYASTAARKAFASAERRVELDRALELHTAAAVTERLGSMKGALMKLGQMASYLDEGMPETIRAALSTLQSDAPPMSVALANEVVTNELGRPPEELFIEWDPTPIAAASIGQVHRALWFDPVRGVERAVAVKIQYPGADQAIAADLGNADLIGLLLKQGFGGLDPKDLVGEIRDRLTEELDYRREAANQTQFADYFRGHPTISIPEVVHELSTSRVLTTELASGSTWADVLSWDQPQRDAIGETLFRFVFRSLYGMHAFNGDPHPGNYLFHGDGRVTFLDFGLVKHFTEDEMTTFIGMVKSAAYDHDVAAFRTIVEQAGLLAPGCPADNDEIGEYFSQFYESVRDDRPVTWSGEYASRIVRHTFDRSSPISQFATVPRAFVFIQRINLGLYALLGQLRATGNYRRIAEELWPFADGAASTPIGIAEAEWMAGRGHPAHGRR